MTKDEYDFSTVVEHTMGGGCWMMCVRVRSSKASRCVLVCKREKRRRILSGDFPC